MIPSVPHPSSSAPAAAKAGDAKAASARQGSGQGGFADLMAQLGAPADDQNSQTATAADSKTASAQTDGTAAAAKGNDGKDADGKTGDSQADATAAADAQTAATTPDAAALALLSQTPAQTPPPPPPATGDAAATIKPAATAPKPGVPGQLDADGKIDSQSADDTPAPSFADALKAAAKDTVADKIADTTAKAASDAPARLAAADTAPIQVAPQPAPDPQPAYSLQPAANTAAAAYGPSASPDAPAPAQGMSQVAAESMSALGLQISKRLKDGNTKFDIELHPADLGKVEVALNIARDGKISAHLSFDTPITATAFHARESELRQQLSAAGLDVSGDSLSFSSRDSGSDASSQSNAGQQGQTSRQNLPGALRALSDAAQAADETDLNTLIADFGARHASGRLALNLLV